RAPRGDRRAVATCGAAGPGPERAAPGSRAGGVCVGLRARAVRRLPLPPRRVPPEPARAQPDRLRLGPAGAARAGEPLLLPARRLVLGRAGDPDARRPGPRAPA